MDGSGNELVYFPVWPRPDWGEGAGVGACWPGRRSLTENIEGDDIACSAGPLGKNLLSGQAQIIIVGQGVSYTTARDSSYLISFFWLRLAAHCAVSVVEHRLSKGIAYGLELRSSLSTNA